MEAAARKKTDFLLFSGLFLFDGVSPEAAEHCYREEGCACLRFAGGEALGSPAGIGLVLSGEVKAFRRGGDGTKIFLNRFSPGEVFGAASAFAPEGPLLSELEATRAGRLLLLKPPFLRRLFERAPRAAENYIAYLSGRVAFLTSRLSACAGGSAEERLGAWILSRCGGEENAVLPCSWSELASVLGISRASLYRCAEHLEEQGAILRQGKSIRVLCPELLQSPLLKQES